MTYLSKLTQTESVVMQVPNYEVVYSEDGKQANYNGHKFCLQNDGYYHGRTERGGKKKLLHRYIYETETGSKLDAHTHLHHIDKIKGNNRLSNLTIISNSEHTTIHNQDKIEKCRIAMMEANKRLDYPGCVASRIVQKAKGYPSLKKANEKKKKPIIRVSQDSELYVVYPCLLDAARDVGKPPIHISECANGKRKSAFGYKWAWENA